MKKKRKKKKSELSYTLTEIGLVAEDWTITEMAEHFRAFADILEVVAKRSGEDCKTIKFDGEYPYPLAILKHENYYKDGSKTETFSNGILAGAVRSRVEGEWSTTYRIGETLLEFAKSGKTLKKYLIEKAEEVWEGLKMLQGQEKGNAENNL